MSPRFQADADFNQRIVSGLRRREPSIELVDAHEGEVVGKSDPEVLEIAAAGGRILISHDVGTMPGHFADFLQQHSSPGLILVPQELSIGFVIEELLLIWAASDAEEWANKLDYLPL